MPESIKPLSVGITDSGNLVVRLSSIASPDWGDAFARYWNHPSTYSTAFRKSTLDRVVGDEVRFRGLTVDEFEEHYKGIFGDAVAAANSAMAELEVKRGEAARSAALAEAERIARLNRDREKASQITFD